MVLDTTSIFVGAAIPPALYLISKAFTSIRTAIRPDRAPRLDGYKVVITGSSRGLGLALAEQFLALGDDVVISSRDGTKASEAASTLKEKYPARNVVSFPCDISQPAQAEALAEFAVQQLGAIDIWINNAGQSQSQKANLPDTPPEVLQSIVSTNLTGSIFGCRAAMRVMLGQPSGGRIFLIDGTGAWGNPTPQNVAYGATKRALTQLKDSLAKEVRGSHVSVHMASPGMVATDLLLTGHSPGSSAAKFINILAEDAAVVSDWLVPRMRGVRGNGAYFKYLTGSGVIWRFLTASGRKGRFIPEKAKAA